ncbi:MAG: hypothetical protein EA360_11910 [Balneolaceae bacterium]|nr:MAG: hypothetical protein EA360_11910 [Balneolaceae bacterium]
MGEFDFMPANLINKTDHTTGRGKMKTDSIFFNFLKVSVFLILILTTLCASCPRNVKDYPVSVTAAADNFDPVHVRVDSYREFRLEPGQTATIKITSDEDIDDYSVMVRLFRMNTLIHDSWVTLTQDKTTYIMIRETSYGTFTVSYSSD